MIGGAERYAMELARAMAERVHTTFISFGAARERYEIGKLAVEIFPAVFLDSTRNRPFSLRFLPLLAGADAIHCHNLGSPATVLALTAGKLLGKKRFITPLGLLPNRGEHIILRAVGMTGILCISAFSMKDNWYSAPLQLIYGGVDTDQFHPLLTPRERKITCIARLVPHKGINYLIDALDPDMRLEIYGRPYDARYYSDLLRLAEGKRVRFFTEATDADIVHAYATSLVNVLPSVYTDMYGTSHAQPELLGLVLLEAMACGTAVVGTNAGAIPEFIEDGETGYIVPPNDPARLHAVLRRLWDAPDLAISIGQKGREVVRQRYTWDAVAQRCLHAYTGENLDTCA